MLAIAALALLPPERASATEVPSPYFGVNAPYLFPFYPPWEVDDHVAAMATGGIEVVRYGARWNEIEPEAPRGDVHDYRWAHLDGVVERLARRNIAWLPVIAYSTPWASTDGSTMSPPADVEQYATYAGAIARRYGRDGDFWRERPDIPPRPVTSFQVWNEPNVAGFWRPRPNAAAYMDLYIAARNAIRTVDPSARVVTAGLTGAGAPAFLRSMLAHRPSAVREIDAVALHPYAATLPETVEQIVAFRRELDKAGGAQLPIDVTEVGWATSPADDWLATSDAERGSRYRWLAEALPFSNCRIERLLLHTWVTPERDPASAGDWFGIYRADATATAAGSGYTQGIASARGGTAAPRGEICDRPAGASAPPRSSSTVPPKPASGVSQNSAPAPANVSGTGPRPAAPPRIAISASRIQTSRTRCARRRATRARAKQCHAKKKRARRRTRSRAARNRR